MCLFRHVQQLNFKNTTHSLTLSSVFPSSLLQCSLPFHLSTFLCYLLCALFFAIIICTHTGNLFTLRVLSIHIESEKR